MFLEEENRMLKTMVDKLHDVGANVLICQKGIDEKSKIPKRNYAKKRFCTEL